jgi:alkyl hydroperoxide reductase subunit F
MELAEILARVDTGAAKREAATLGAKAPFDMLVVGGGPAGAAAAVYAARKGIRTGVVAERFGGQTLDTLGIENFISGAAHRGPEVRRRAAGPCARVRRGHHERPACGAPGTGRRAGGLIALTLANGASAEEPQRGAGHRRALAQRQRAR